MPRHYNRFRAPSSMRRMVPKPSGLRSHNLGTVALIIVALLTACEDATNPRLPTLGGIRVTSLTTGPDADSDGYSIAVDGSAGISIATNGAVMINNVLPGTHVVRLDGVATNCTSGYGTTREVTVSAGQLVEVDFA